MRRYGTVTVALIALGALAAGLLQARERRQANWQQSFRDGIRRPLGVYAHFDIEDLTSGYTGTNVHAYLHGIYAGLLADDAVTGITVGQHWDHIQVSDPNCVLTHSCLGDREGYDWSYLDDAFGEAEAAHKSVQLIITPGVDAPLWLLAKIPPCDGLFATPNPEPVAPNCGTFLFQGFPEEGRADYTNPVFPLPWNGVYKAAWWDFLAHLSARYSENPAFVAMEIGGPNGASVEIILPTSANETQRQEGGLTADDVWSALIQHSFPNVSEYQNSDQVFIDQWDQAIDVYERLFSGVTLILSPDAGDDLPLFKNQNSTVPPPPDSDLALFNQDCSAAINGTKDDLRSCEAKTEIITHFLNAWGPNAKSTEVGGMTASSAVTPGDIGLPGIKLLTLLPPPERSILAGAQFDHDASNPKDGEGCTPPEGPSCTLAPEQAAYNVLQVFFDGTSFAFSFGGTNGPYSVTYLDVPTADIQYAEAPANQCPSTTLGTVSFQDLLNKANHELFALAGEWIPLRPLTCK
ncbi:MAG TPA: hypothetical protein VN862_10325 [Candidatus Acidoferrales bacterium]|nr:hypothetical protein [Candidatus Acidoferrales bacterium]